MNFRVLVRWAVGLSILALVSLAVFVTTAMAQTPVGTAFTYQGALEGASGPVTDTCAFEFKLYNALSGGGQVGTTQTKTGVSVNQGIFSVQLDFGANVFAGEARWLQIAVRCSGQASYTPLTPRQPLTPTPYAISALRVVSGAITPTMLSGITSTGVASQSLVSNGSGGFAWRTISVVSGVITPTMLSGITSTGVASQSLVSNGSGGFAWQTLSDLTHVLTVGDGGEYATINDALDAITNNGSDQRYLIQVGPGTFNERVDMKQYVDIEGSGEEVTTIAYTGAAHDLGVEGAYTLKGASHAELRFLTVVSDGGDSREIAPAIYNNGTSPRLTHVTAVARGGTWEDWGVYNVDASPTMESMTVSVTGGRDFCVGVYNKNPSSPMMRHMTVTASAGASAIIAVYNTDRATPTLIDVVASAGDPIPGAAVFAVFNEGISGQVTMQGVIATASGDGAGNIGVDNFGASATLNNCTVSASGAAGTDDDIALRNRDSGTVKVNNSQLTGADYAIQNTVNTYVGASLLDGDVVVDAGSVTCANVYDGDYKNYSDTCP